MRGDKADWCGMRGDKADWCGVRGDGAGWCSACARGGGAGGDTTQRRRDADCDGGAMVRGCCLGVDFLVKSGFLQHPMVRGILAQLYFHPM